MIVISVSGLHNDEGDLHTYIR